MNEAAAETAPFVVGEELLASPSRAYAPQPAVVVSCEPHAKLLARGIVVWLLTFRVTATGREHTVQTYGRDYLSTVIAPVARPEITDQAIAEVGAAMDGPRPAAAVAGGHSAQGPLDRARAVGVDVRRATFDIGDFRAVWVVTASTDLGRQFESAVAVCASEETAVRVALDNVGGGARIEEFALLP